MLLCGFAVASSHADEGWPKFRGPGGDGIARDADPPVSWDRQTNIAWRTELPGQGWSSPVVVGDSIYVSAAVPLDERRGGTAGDEGDGSDDHDLVLIRADLESGEIRRVSRLSRRQAGQSPDIHKKNSHASPTPLISGDRIFVHFGHQGTACTDLEGNVLWVNRDHPYPPVHGNGGSPVLVDGALVVTADGGEDPFVLALDATDGSELWKVPRPVDATKKFSFATPTVIETESGPLVVAPGSDCVTAHDPKTGEIRWLVRYDGYSVVPKPVLSHGRILVTTGFGPTKLMAIRPGGEGDVTDSHVDWELDRGIPKTPSLLADGGLVYIVSDDGIATCVDGRDGSTVWRNRLGGNYSASPVLAGNRIYFTSEEGVTTVIRAGREFEKLAANDLEEAILASPAVVGDRLIIRTDRALYRIEKKDTRL